MPGENFELGILRKDAKEKREQRMHFKNLSSNENVTLDNLESEVDNNVNEDLNFCDNVEPKSYQDLLDIIESQNQQLIIQEIKITDLQNELNFYKPKVII